MNDINVIEFALISLCFFVLSLCLYALTKAVILLEYLVFPSVMIGIVFLVIALMILIKKNKKNK